MTFRDLRTAKDAAKELEISVAALNLLRARGTLPGHRVGLVWLYLKEDIDRVREDPEYQKRSRKR